MGEVIWVQFGDRGQRTRVRIGKDQYVLAAGRLERAAAWQDDKTAATLRRLASEYRSRAT